MLNHIVECTIKCLCIKISHEFNYCIFSPFLLNIYVYFILSICAPFSCKICFDKIYPFKIQLWGCSSYKKKYIYKKFNYGLVVVLFERWWPHVIQYLWGSGCGLKCPCLEIFECRLMIFTIKFCQDST